MEAATATQTAPATDAGAQPTTEQKVDATVQMGAQIAEAVLPAPAAAVIAAGVELEPAVYHFISFLIHAFKKPKQQQQPATTGSAK